MTSGCGYDIYSRVSCAALVAAALAFAIILTDVFVDIDGLIINRDKAKAYDPSEPVFENERSHADTKTTSNDMKPEYYKEEKSYDEDSEEAYRNKRSLESPNFLYHVKNPKMKSILTDRLATLLEELDEEESIPALEKNKEVKSEEKIEVMQNNRKKHEEVNENKDEREKLESLLEAMKINNKRLPEKEEKRPATKHEMKTEEDMLHLAMHNILLQGIIGHMDLSEVFKKVHMLVKSFRSVEDPKEEQIQTPDKQDSTNLHKEIKNMIKKNSPSIDENKFFEELTKCDKLQKDITNTKAKGLVETKIDRLMTQKEPKLLIKTIIDITSKKDKPKELLNSKESIKGIIKLIYNGKPIQFSRMEDDDQPTVKRTTVKPTTMTEATNDMTEKQNEIEVDELKVDTPKAERFSAKKTYFNQIIEDYLQKYPKNFGDIINAKGFEGKRLKRQIKIRYQDDETASSTKKPKGDDDDELYVEIETHFDSKGMKGMKKKKLIRTIIDKIQKAIHSDMDLTKVTDDKKKKHKHLQVKKRTQNPLDDKYFMNKIVVPIDSVIKRHSDQLLSKSSPIDKYSDKSGETWRKAYYSPGFLTVTKSLNSAEMGEVDVDYNKVMAVNGIPQRLQKPLNTDVSEEMINAKPYFDLGNLKFFVKNIDGTGLSIGFNQYTDEPPDPDTIKLFTGIENLIQTYHHTGDDTPSLPPRDLPKSSEEMEHEKRDINDKFNNDHMILRRSIKEHDKDYHTNEYKIIVEDNNFLPYQNYQEIYEDQKRRVAISMDKQPDSIPEPKAERINNENIKSLPQMMEDNIFYKKLKPSEILSLATLLDRKKRALVVQKIRNIKGKVKLNKYINTHTMSRKKIILNKKRPKRQIDKIRIIATETMPKSRHSDENIFIVDDDNVLADRAIIREIDPPDMVEKMEGKIQENYEMLPYVYEAPSYTTNEFGGRSRHNQLMSKYPHIFLEEIARSREETEPIFINKYDVRSRMTAGRDQIHIIGDNHTAFIEKPTPIHTMDEVVNAIEPKQNYKFTVKIFPKNNTDLNSGFKEIHTSINKSFNKDGLIYSSLVNVSEISKIEKLHKVNDVKPTSGVSSTESAFVKRIQEQQNKMDILLRQHKQRIDEQLDHLKKERHTLDSLAHKAIENGKHADHTNAKPAGTEIPNIDSISNMNRDDVSKLLASALFKLESQRTDMTTVTKVATTEPTTVEPIKMKLLNKIEENENVTNQILNQINKNNEMLRTFLEKLTDKLTKDTQRRERSEELPKFMTNLQKLWKPYQPLPEGLYQPQIQFDSPKNYSHFAIPFVYAYQQSFPLNKNFKPDIPIASIVYHGHIHANSLKNIKHDTENTNLNQTKVNAGQKEIHNETRYFIDTLENDLPVVQGSKIIINKNVPPLTTTPRL